jgi:hypothetical protein
MLALLLQLHQGYQTFKAALNLAGLWLASAHNA